MKNNKIIAITMGDPAGVGPEIIIKSLLNPALSHVNAVVVGCPEIFQKVMDLGITPKVKINPIDQVSQADFTLGVMNVISEPIDNINSFKPRERQAQAGDVAYRCITTATALAMANEVQAMATAPLNKEALHMAGHMYPGHTELLAKLTQSKNYAMLLYTDKLKVIHVSTHIALRKFLDTLNGDRVKTVIKIAEQFFNRIGIDHPKIAVAGVNPHAGENGLFGREEINILIPAIEEMREIGLNVIGPCPPDTVFLQAHQGMYDIVVAMYHDQGHIPLKLLGFYDGVNITAGLPFLRTSADHGTAFDIAWKGLAKPESMEQSIRLAMELG